MQLHIIMHVVLVASKNRTKCVGRWQRHGSCAVCIDLQAVGVLEFSGELNRRFSFFFREREGSIFSNHQTILHHGNHLERQNV